MPMRSEHSSSHHHSSQVVYGVGTKKSYKGQEGKASYTLRIVLVALMLTVAIAALVLWAAAAL